MLFLRGCRKASGLKASPTKSRTGGAGFRGMHASLLRCRKGIHARCFFSGCRKASGLKASPTKSRSGGEGFWEMHPSQLRCRKGIHARCSFCGVTKSIGREGLSYEQPNRRRRFPGNASVAASLPTDSLDTAWIARRCAPVPTLRALAASDVPAPAPGPRHRRARRRHGATRGHIRARWCRWS